MYRPRIADAELRRRLGSAGAVVVEGPRACGKTELARQVAGSEVLLDTDENARLAAAIEPGHVLEGAAPRLIDEWQVEPRIWNHVRRAVDDSREPGRFILTGSAMPPDDATRHTGAGRMSRMRLGTMSLAEAGVSSGAVPLAGMLEGEFQGCADPGPGIGDIIVQICRGGWPGDLAISDEECLAAREDYLEEICRTDISRVDGVRRDPELVRRTLRSLARNIATTASVRAIATDAGGERPLDHGTVDAYLGSLQRLMVIENQPAWSTHLRSRSRLRGASKRHFADPSLATAALRATPGRLLDDLRLLGQLFESLVWRDLSVYARACGATLHHYRDNTGLEVDMVVETAAGAWCAFEVRLAANQANAGAAALLRFRERVDTGRAGEPALLGVIVASGPGYMRRDNVAIIPVGALGH